MAAAPSSLFLLIMLLRMARTLSTSSSSVRDVVVKDLWILRHGQATHNPRAEAAKDAGCSFEEFFDLMRQDDSLDSPLTELGHEQAANVYRMHSHLLRPELVVSSPLSRALQTANGALPPDRFSQSLRVVYEGFREINGVLKNAQRRSRTELRQRFPDWNFDLLTDENDQDWDEETLESYDDCKERGFQGLKWIYHERPETSILLVAHGGILRYTMQEHDQVVVQDGRTEKSDRLADARFGNCELRRYQVSWDENKGNIILTEIDQEHQIVEETHSNDDAAVAEL